MEQTINVSVRTNGTPAAQYKTVILKPNVIDDVNILTQAMMSQPNTKYVIKYDYTLAENITVPANCVLEFDGGDIDNNNHSLSLADDTIVINVKGSVCTTANRPTPVSVGYQSFDTTLGKPIWFDGENWVDATGATV